MSDNNYQSYADEDGLHVDGMTLAPPYGGFAFDDIWKLSHVTNSTFSNVKVIAGAQRENALDSNRNCTGNTLRGLQLDAGKQCAVLLKDGWCDNVVDDVLITHAGGHSDWYEGDYSDQGGDKNTGNRYNNVRRIDGQPVRVAWTFFRAEKPRFTNSNVRYQYCLSALRTLYVELKYAFPIIIP